MLVYLSLSDILPEGCSVIKYGITVSAAVSLFVCNMFGSIDQRWADRYFGPLVRCPADYRNVSGPADWKK